MRRCFVKRHGDTFVFPCRFSRLDGNPPRQGRWRADFRRCFVKRHGNTFCIPVPLILFCKKACRERRPRRCGPWGLPPGKLTCHSVGNAVLDVPPARMRDGTYKPYKNSAKSQCLHAARRVVAPYEWLGMMYITKSQTATAMPGASRRLTGGCRQRI